MPDEAGDIVAEEAFANSREVLSAFSARYPGASFVMETGTHSPWVSRLLSALGYPVIVANVRKLRAISQSHTPCVGEEAQHLAGGPSPRPAIFLPRNSGSRPPEFIWNAA